MQLKPMALDRARATEFIPEDPLRNRTHTDARPHGAHRSATWVTGIAIAWAVASFATVTFGFQALMAPLGVIVWLVHGILLPWSVFLLASAARGAVVAFISWALVRRLRAPKSIWLGFGIGAVANIAVIAGFLALQGGGYGALGSVEFLLLSAPFVDAGGAYVGTLLGVRGVGAGEIAQ